MKNAVLKRPLKRMNGLTDTTLHTRARLCSTCRRYLKAGTPVVVFTAPASPHLFRNEPAPVRLTEQGEKVAKTTIFCSDECGEIYLGLDQ
jgi:hypothetical protein